MVQNIILQHKLYFGYTKKASNFKDYLTMLKKDIS